MGTIHRELSWSWLASSMLLAVLALFSKEQGVTVLDVRAVVDVFIISKVKVELKQLIDIITKVRFIIVMSTAYIYNT